MHVGVVMLPFFNKTILLQLVWVNIHFFHDVINVVFSLVTMFGGMIVSSA